tara:strand:+ start:11048 stop:11509 length:462 start_codon:yes stop_codon:yes gene_type:complete
MVYFASKDEQLNNTNKQFEDINTRFENINKRLDKLSENIILMNKKLDKIYDKIDNDLTKECKKMGSHIDFVENVYENVKHPLGYICNKIKSFSSSTDQYSLTDSSFCIYNLPIESPFENYISTPIGTPPNSPNNSPVEKYEDTLLLGHMSSLT